MRPIAVVLLLAGLAQAQDGLPPVPVVQAPPAGQKNKGFALETRIGTQLVALTGVGSVGTFSGGIFAGYKLNRFIFGLGFDLARVATSTSAPGSDQSEATTVFYFTPGIRATIVRSQDQRVDFFGQADIGLGTSVDEESPAPTGPQPDVTRFRLYYNLGPGIRFWAHPQFAIGTVAGVHGDFVFAKTTIPNSNVSSSQSATTTSIFATLQLLGVF